MRAGRPSRTAEHNALFRALETALPPDRRLFDDPLARAFLTWPLSGVSRLATVPGGAALVRRYIDRRWPGVRTSVVARTRLIDDAIGATPDDAIGQVVILGAGYDSRAHRLRRLLGVAVFEVDHPDTQAAKRRALDRVLPAQPTNVRYVPCDFGAGDLDTAMAGAGFRDGAPTLLLWEGVTNYLTASAVDATLDWCARAGSGSPLIFTYVHADVITEPSRFVGTARLTATLASAGEGLTFGIDPAGLESFLADRGLVLEDDLGAAEYRERYLGDAARRIEGHEFYRVAIARVAG